MKPPKLHTENNLADPDTVYRALVAAHRRLDPGAHAAFDAALVLLLANHIGDAEVLREALAAAAAAVREN